MLRQEQIDRARQEGMEYYGFGPAVMKKLKVCGYCGTMAQSNQHFCNECGRRLPKTTLYHRYQEKHRCCPKCKVVLADNMQFCPQCGEKIG